MRRWAVASAGFCSFLDMYSTQALLPLLKVEFGVGEAMAAATVSATTFAVALVAPASGHLADRFGRKRVIVAGAFLMAVPTALAALSGDVTQLIFWRFLQGLFLPAVFSVTTAHIGEEWPASEAPAMIGLHMSGMVAGAFIGRYVTALVAEAVGWRLAFPALALLNLMGAAAIALWMPKDRPQPARSGGGGGAAAVLPVLLRNWPLMATCLIGFLLLFGMTATFTYMNFHLSEEPYHFGPVALGNLFIITLLGIPASAVGPPLLRRLSRQQLTVGAALLTCGGLVLTLAVPPVVIFVGLGVFAFAKLISQPLALGLVGRLTPVGKAMAVGFYVSSYYLGGSVGAVAPAWVWSHWGWPGCVALVAVTETLIAVLAVLAWRRV